jgi:hypothetical protein
MSSDFIVVRPFEVTDSLLVSSNVTENDYAEWDAGTGYTLGQRVIVIGDGDSPETFYHNIYESVLAGTNTGNNPWDDPQWPDGAPTNWLLVGKTNRWKMFDNANSSQTTNAESIEVNFTTLRRANAIACLNVDAEEIEVIVEDPAPINVTNLLTYSEQFDNAAWTKVNATITANATTAPDGTLTADKLVEDTATSLHYVSQVPPGMSVIGETYAISVMAKPDERSIIEIRVPGGATMHTNNQARVFNLVTGAVTAGAGIDCTGEVEILGNGYVRCTLLVTANRAGAFTHQFRLSNGAATNYTGDGTSGLYIWGAQLEVGEPSGYYVKTEATSASDNFYAEVFNQTYRMIESTGESSFYAWHFGQIQRKTDLFVQDIPPYVGARIYVNIKSPGGTAKCGTLLVGYAESFGDTMLGAGLGIQDFSVKRQNDFGDFEILERAYNRRGEFSVFIDNDIIDRLITLLASRRATPTLYIGTTTYSSSYIYGFYRDFDVVIQYPSHSLINLELEGLT